MALLGLLTLWAGVASWRRNAGAGLHAHDLSGSPPPAAQDTTSQPDAPPRRRRRPAADGN
jgi:hypothetical protein